MTDKYMQEINKYLLKEITRDGAGSTVDPQYLDMDDFDPNKICCLFVTDDAATEMIKYCEDVIKTITIKAYETDPDDLLSGLTFFGYPKRGKTLSPKLRDLLRIILKAMDAGMLI